MTVTSDQLVVAGKEHSPCIWNMLYTACSINTKFATQRQILDRNRLSETYTAVLLSTILFFKHGTYVVKKVYVSILNQ